MTEEDKLAQQRKLLADNGYTIQTSGPISWWALLPGETQFHDDGEGNQNYLGFFSSEKDLLDEVAENLQSDTAANPTWLFAYSAGGAYSGYQYATIIVAKDEREAVKFGARIACRELRGERGGISFDVDAIESALTDSSLYASRLRPEARAMVDIHWSNRDAIVEHWSRVLREPDSDDQGAASEQANALGFESVEAMLSNERRVAAQRLNHAEEVAYQSSAQAQLRREQAAVPDSTWVTLQDGPSDPGGGPERMRG